MGIAVIIALSGLILVLLYLSKLNRIWKIRGVTVAQRTFIFIGAIVSGMPIALLVQYLPKEFMLLSLFFGAGLFEYSSNSFIHTKGIWYVFKAISIGFSMAFIYGAVYSWL